MVKKSDKSEDVEDLKIKDSSVENERAADESSSVDSAEKEAKKIENEAKQTELPSGPGVKSELVPDLESSQTANAGKNASGVKSSKKSAKIRAFFGTKWGKAVAALLFLAFVIGILLAIPTTRYGILGNVIKKDVVINVIDSETKDPVTQAQVELAGQTTTTDSDGNASFKSVGVGKYTAKISKKYYSDASTYANVWITKNVETGQVQLTATGRQVPVKVLNAITKNPLENAVVSATDTSVKTDENGEATLVLSAELTEVEGTVAADGYNTQTVQIKVTEQVDDANVFSVTPSGKVYFLSKRTGKISVMKSNLDGTSVEEVLAGTGNEEEHDTQLLATRDWKYVALKARREGDKAKLYLINTSNDQLTTIDEGDAEFMPIGWYNERFIYKVSRNNLKNWQDGHEVIKSFSATTAAATEIDYTKGEGDDNEYAYEYYSNSIQVLNNEILAVKNWYGCKKTVYSVCENTTKLDDKKDSVTRVVPDGSNNSKVKEVATKDHYVSSKASKTRDLLIQVSVNSPGGKNQYFRYNNGTVTDAPDIDDTQYNKPYTTYSMSPNGQKSFWYESRDGKNIFFIGDSAGDNATEILSGTDYMPFGWFTNDYLLVSKDSSELYIMPATSGDAIKIDSYHKPTSSFPGQGYSYGWY